MSAAKLLKIEVTFCGWGERWLFGTLASDGVRTLFEYSPEALARGIEFSPRHLPLSQATFHDFPRHLHGLPGLFADSLPDGWGLLLMDRFFKQHLGREAHTIQPLERLAFLGARALGAFAYHPVIDGVTADEVLDLPALAAATMAQLHGSDSDLLRTLAMAGGSPQGARPKAMVYYDPATGAMSTHPFDHAQPWLVKFPAQGESAEACAIEAAYMDMAARCGLDVPHHRLIAIDESLSALAMQRFDWLDGARLPMHSLAGALHADFRLPQVSYGVFLRMTRLMTRSEAQVAQAFARCVFNVCLNNRDDHTKNMAYLMAQPGVWTLSPAYDLTYNTGFNGHHQMDIEGESLHIRRAHLLALGEGAGLSKNKCERIVDEVLSACALWGEVLAGYPIGVESAQLLQQVVRDNCLLLRA